MVAKPNGRSATLAAAAHPSALPIQIRRNLLVQGLGLGMVTLLGLTVLPWPIVMVWSLAATIAIALENRLLRGVAVDPESTRACAWAPVLRVCVTTIYAVAAYALIVKGGAGHRMFAFALMTSSMVHVLMRYYLSRRILMASLTPYLIVLGMVTIGLARASLQQGNLVGALAAVFTIGILAVQFWSARAQLASAWMALMFARQDAEGRERAADAANPAKSQFLATMSHELRTPLNGVLGMAQALAADRLTQVQRERVKVIRRSSENLLSVLNDLLDLARIEAGSLSLEVAEFDLEHLVRGVAAAYRPRAENKGLAFEFDISAGACGCYLGDSARIRRVLYSLCENAVKFTETGGVSLRVDGDNGTLAFHVMDTGVGVADGDLTHLFEDFFQADATLTRPHDGAGVGLAICRDLTSLMGGMIEASSELGKGSTFTVRVPLERVESFGELDRGEPQAAELERPAELRVLAAEDNPTNQLVLKTLLAQAGIVPSFVENGREALIAWEDQTWDIILMDIQMPEMNGVEATRGIRLRELETGRVRTPIIAVTANAMTHQVGEYTAAGMDSVVAKPIAFLQLFQEMEQALANADAAQAEPSGGVIAKESAVA